jgi:hypothetical protein
MKTQLQLLATTIALTVLIWVYADQSSHEFYTANLLVRYVAPPDPDHPLVVRVRDAKGEAKDALRAEVTFRGPKSAVRRLQGDDAAGRFKPSIVLSEPLRPGLQPARDLYLDLSRLPEIRSRGVMVQRALPASVQLDIDRYVDVPVELQISGGSFEKALEAPPIARPEKVTARVLESELPYGGTLPPLRLSIEEQLQARPETAGGSFGFDVPVRSSWPGIEAILIPDHVRVSGRLARRTTVERITTIPLGVLIEPENFLGRYEIEWQDQTGANFTQAITARVPVEKVGQLKGNMIDAYVTIQDSDLPRELPGVSTAPATQESWIEREIRFVFPAGFEDVKIEGPPRTVKFRIRKRTELTPITPTTPLPIVPVPTR